MGRNAIGEHVWRVSGSRLLARAGVPLTQIALMARWGSDIILRYVAETPLDTITESFASSSCAGTTSNLMANAVAGQEDDDHLQDDLTLACDDDESDGENDYLFVINTGTGVLHMLPPTNEADPMDTASRTLCGRERSRACFDPVAHYVDSYISRGILQPIAHCSQCATPAAWAAIVDNAPADISY
jgi:hypothetical protein